MDVATVLRARDLRVAEQTVSNIIDPRRFCYPGRVRPSNVRISHVAMNVGHLFGARHGVPVHVTSEPITSYQIMVPLRGRLQVERNIEPGSAFVYSPRDRMNTFWSPDCVSLVLSLPENSFRGFLRRMFPDRDWRALPRSAPRIDLSADSGRSFANILGTICRESLNENSAFRLGVSTRSLEESLLLSLLMVLSDDLLPVTGRPSPCRRATVARAVEYINDNCQDEIVAADLVAAAGVSIRSLQMGFMERFGVGPMTYLKQVRLRRVHEALRAADPGRQTVGDIAAEWGFYNGSAFAKAYKAFFGELPSKTLSVR